MRKIATEAAKEAMKDVYTTISTNKEEAARKIESISRKVASDARITKNRIKKSHSKMAQLMVKLQKSTIKQLQPSSAATASPLGGSK